MLRLNEKMFFVLKEKKNHLECIIQMFYSLLWINLKLLIASTEIFYFNDVLKNNKL